jgi:hypothetical protein
MNNQTIIDVPTKQRSRILRPSRLRVKGMFSTTANYWKQKADFYKLKYEEKERIVEPLISENIRLKRENERLKGIEIYHKSKN